MQYVTLFVCISVVCANLTLVVGDVSRCPKGLKYHIRALKEKCYQFADYEVYWPDASAACSQAGGILAKITNRETQDFLVKTLYNDLHWGYKGIWIGANSLQDRGKWIWTDGSAVTYTSWAPGQPIDEKCAQIRLDANGDWHATSCDNWPYHYSYICQFDMIPTTIQTTTSEVVTDSSTLTSLPSITTTTGISSSTNPTVKTTHTVTRPRTTSAENNDKGKNTLSDLATSTRRVTGAESTSSLPNSSPATDSFKPSRASSMRSTIRETTAADVKTATAGSSPDVTETTTSPHTGATFKATSTASKVKSSYDPNPMVVTTFKTTSSTTSLRSTTATTQGTNIRSSKGTYTSSVTTQSTKSTDPNTTWHTGVGQPRKGLIIGVSIAVPIIVVATVIGLTVALVKWKTYKKNQVLPV